MFFVFFRKSAKSLFFLLPLLGISNVLHFVWPNPLRGSWQSFAVWSVTSHFLSSFQGLFVASVYFLFDDKVKLNSSRVKSIQEFSCAAFLHDWQPPLIFVRFTSNFLCMCTYCAAQEVCGKSVRVRSYLRSK